MRTRFTPLAIAAAGVMLCCSAAPADEGSSVLSYLDGGHLSCRAELSLGFLYGAGARPDALGTPVGTLRAGAAAATGNPAGLGFLTSGEILLDGSPGVGASVNELLDAEARAASEIDEAIEDVADDDIDITYPELDTWAGQKGGVLSGAAAVPVGPVTVAIAIEEPVNLDLRIVDTGIEALAETVKSEGDASIEITARCFLDAAGDVSLRVEKTTLAAGARLAPAVSVGAALSRVTARASLSGVVRGDGIVDYGGQEYAFNDPGDPWHNELGASAEGTFEGSGIGWTAGVSWRPSGRFAVDLAYSRAPDLSLEGSLTTVENTIPAVSEDGVDVELISASQPTLTEETITVEDDPVGLELPSYLGAAVSARAGILLATLEYRRFGDTIAYEYDGEAEGIDLGSALGLELDIGGFWAGGGFVQGTLLPDDGGQREAVTVPFANVGFGVPLGDNVRLDTLILAVPVQVMRLSVSCRL